MLIFNCDVGLCKYMPQGTDREFVVHCTDILVPHITQSVQYQDNVLVYGSLQWIRCQINFNLSRYTDFIAKYNMAIKI